MAPIVRRRPARKLSERVPSFFYRKNKPVTPTEKKNETNECLHPVRLAYRQGTMLFLPFSSFVVQYYDNFQIWFLWYPLNSCQVES